MGVRTPRLMCTQHPDSTIRLSAQDEITEAIQARIHYGCEEVMIDYEGKLTPYSQPKDIVEKALAHNIDLGESFYLTVRIPNPQLEEIDRVMLSIEAALVANYYSMKNGGVQAVRWVVLPMTESGELVALIQRILTKKTRLFNEEFNIKVEPVVLVPLLESYESLTRASSIAEALKVALQTEQEDLGYVRIFLGKSDTAVKSGHIASAIALLHALNRLHDLSTSLSLSVKPIIGMGSPPFRGGINNPELVDVEVEQYSGYSTATVQSAVRYDVSMNDYNKVRMTILEKIDEVSRKIEDEALSIAEKARSAYRSLLAKYATTVSDFAKHIPTTRDRVSWKTYGRVIESDNGPFHMPRAIIYTSTWYLLGLPPTLLDASFIVQAYNEGFLDDLLKILPSLEREWNLDSLFYVPQAVEKRLGSNIVNTVNNALDILGIKPERNETYATILSLGPSEAVALALGRIRGFLG
ncbi:MAG: phosphoenolpyruvate carboxylase [Acidilobaceae archaeon]